MRRNRRFPARALALAVVLIGPAAARAQLFPDLQIKRQRPCCAAEDPRYRIIREQYFGYYPTCWRRFPPGWGCPSPEAPNWEASLREVPLQQVTEEGEGAEPGGEERFDPFTTPGARRGAGGAPATPPELPPVPDEPGGSLFDLNPTPPGGTNPPPGPGPDRTPPAGGLPGEPPSALPGTGASGSQPPAGGADAGSVPAARPIGLESPSLETSGAFTPAGPDLGPALASPEDSALVPSPDLGTALESPVAPPLAPPAGFGLRPMGPPATIHGPVTGGPSEYEPIIESQAPGRGAPRRGLFANFLGRSRKR